MYIFKVNHKLNRHQEYFSSCIEETISAFYKANTTFVIPFISWQLANNQQ